VDILFVTDSPDLRTKLKTRRLSFISYVQAVKAIKKTDVATLIYVDPGGAAIHLETMLSLASKNNNVLLGVIDPKSKVKNVMDLIHRGVVDYISAKEIPRELVPRRFKKTINFIKKFRIESTLLSRAKQLREANGSGYIPVLHGWKDIKPGHEYTFSIMFIEMDEREEMENRYGMRNLSKALAVFRAYIDKNVVSFGGKIWLWSHFGGVALFPFNANECNSILCGFRIFMGKHLHDAEESHFPNFISFRLALHLGNLFYQETNKGEVISDSLNTVFHLGQKYAEPGHFYMTEDIFKYGPSGLKPFFRETNSYENRMIYRMRNQIL
jgi:hypothetical protein